MVRFSVSDQFPSEFAICAVIVLYILIVMNGNYQSGDLYSFSRVVNREVFRGRPELGNLLYFAFHVLFYGYQIGLVYRFATGDFREPNVGEGESDG
jgi:hypothetical protein